MSMWGGSMGGGAPPPPPPMGGQFRPGGQPGQAQGGAQQSQQSQQKHDIFVGNLAFSTTEEQLTQAFSELGRLVKVRMVKDLETGKPRGFAFIEFEDPQAALSAIRNMNDYELNGRRIRVNFSNSSHLETLAGELGMDMSHATAQRQQQQTAAKSASGGGAEGDKTGTQAVAESLKSMSKGEMYDVVAKLKEIADSDPDEARRLLCSHPQLPEAILHLMSKLEMIKTPVTNTMGPGAVPPPPPQEPPPTNVPPPLQPPQPPAMRASDPRARASDPRAALSDPRAARADPRAAARAQQQQPPPQPMSGVPPPPGAGMSGMPPPPPNMSQPPPPLQGAPPPPPQFGGPPPMQQPPPGPPPQQGGQPAPGVANLDPSLVQQVMSLTPAQISQLPPDKQQSILALRQQITGGR